MVARPRKNSEATSARSYHARSNSASGANIDDGWSAPHSRFLTTDQVIPEADTPLKENFQFPPGDAYPRASLAGQTGGSYLLLVFMRVILSPVHYIRHIYRYSSRYLAHGGRRVRRTLLDPVFGRIAGSYQIIPPPGKGNTTRGRGYSRSIFIFLMLVFLLILYKICGGVFSTQHPRYVQGKTYPVDISDPSHTMIYHMEGMSLDLNLTPYKPDRHADIFRINLTHPTEPPVALYKYLSALQSGYEGKTYIYESVPLNNSKVVFKQFAVTSSQPVPREIRSKILSESRALNRKITGESDWTSGMSVLASEGNLWGWSSQRPDGKVTKYGKVLRDKQLEWPVEVAASMRQWLSFREVLEKLVKEMGHTNVDIGRRKKIEKWSIEEEQEEGELIKVLDVFYLPDFEITEVDMEEKIGKRAFTGDKRKRAEPTKQTEEGLSKAELLEKEALKIAAELVEEMESEELAERREENRNTISTSTGQKVKKILRNLSTDIESWGMVLPLLEGGDLDHLVSILPLIGLSPVDLDWLYRPLFSHGVLKALARIHHTKEDKHDRNQFRWQLISGEWYREWGHSEFTTDDNKEHIGTHGIPRARRPQRIDDYAQGYCHGDVKLDNILVRRVPAEKKATIETTISDADAAPHQFRKPEDYLAIMKTEKTSPTLEPPRGPRHYLVLSDLSQTRPLHNARHIRGNWRDCRLVDMDRAWRSYLHLIRMGSRIRRDRTGGESPTKRFDEVFLRWRNAFIGSNGLLPFRPPDVDVRITHGGRSTRISPLESEEYAAAYFTWLANPQIPSAFFSPQNITREQSTHGISASDFWARELPHTRRISIMGSPVREMSRSQVFSVIDGMRGEVDLIRDERKSGRPVAIPSWYYEFGGEGRARPGGWAQGERTEEERLVEEGTQVLQAVLMGM